MRRVDLESDETGFGQKVRDPLNTLTTPSQEASDVGNRFPPSSSLQNLEAGPGLTVTSSEDLQPSLVPVG